MINVDLFYLGKQIYIFVFEKQIDCRYWPKILLFSPKTAEKQMNWASKKGENLFRFEQKRKPITFPLLICHKKAPGK
jgi:hypothetical protein